MGGIAANSGFSAREIENFTAGQAAFWWAALAAYFEKVKETQE